MLWRAFAIVPLVLIGVACGNCQSELNDLRTRVESAHKETNDLKLTITAEVTELKERIARLEVQPAKAEAAKGSNTPSSDSVTINRVIAECVRRVRSLVRHAIAMNNLDHGQPKNTAIQNN